MKMSFEPWQINRWPLIELGMTRRDCLRWLERHGYPMPPKSACIGCPYHSDTMWRQRREEDPDALADAVAIDRLHRTRCRKIGRTSGREHVSHDIEHMGVVEHIKNKTKTE